MQRSFTGNALLDRLSAADREHLLPDLRTVILAPGQLVYAAEQPIRTVYFPQVAVCSFVATLAHGGTTEVAAIGGEGMVGTPVLLGDTTAAFDCIAHIPGSALALESDALLRHAAGSPTLRGRMLRFTQALTFHAAQSAACAARHPLQERCARWLLAAADRRRGQDLALTHDVLAMMLGVRHDGVSQAIADLERAGWIRAGTGRITIVDRAGLETATCECYGRVRQEYARLLEDPVPRAAPVHPAAFPGRSAALPLQQSSDYRLAEDQ